MTSDLVPRICIGIWVFFIVIRLPTIYPFHITAYAPADVEGYKNRSLRKSTSGIVIYRIEEQTALIFYIWIGLVSGTVNLIVTYFCYVFLVIKIFVDHVRPIFTMLSSRLDPRQQFR